jgi:thiol-disulfide isomerase/thioredoxin
MLTTRFTNRVLPLTVILASLAVAPSHGRHAMGPPVEIGNSPPRLCVQQWIKGAPVEHFESGTVYLVAFWNTQSAPAKELIPRLTAIAQKFRGKVEVIGVNSYQQLNPGEERLEVIEEFTSNMGSAMDFHVAADVPLQDTGEIWLRSTGEMAIPTVFLIEKDGKVGWIGQPDERFESLVARAVESSLDREGLKEERRRARAVLKEEQDEVANVNTLWRDKKYSEAVAALDRLVARYPVYQQRMTMFRFNLLLDADEPAAYQYARELAAGEFQGQAHRLAGIAREICQRTTLKHPDFGLARDLATQACKLSGNKDPRYLATLAEVSFSSGDRGEAVEVMERAIQMAMNDTTPEAIAASGMLEDMNTRLEQFKAAVPAANDGDAREKGKSAP